MSLFLKTKINFLGSHKDFKYIYPNLNRFIGVNWPSMGFTDCKFFDMFLVNILDNHSLVDDNNERIQIVQHIIDELKLENVVFIGHSRGSENALKMAALNQVKFKLLN